MSSIKKTVIIGIGVLIAIGAFAIFAMNGAKKSGTSAVPTTAPTQMPTEAQASPTASEAGQMVTIEGTDYSFSPSTITLTKDKPVTITFKNMGKLPHNLVITDLGVSTDTISPGKETTVEVTTSKVGTFAFICSIGNHAEKGMQGEVVVK